MTEIERQILEMVAEERGLSASRVTLESRLLHDLGMDGDDAGEFFAAVSERFGTDLTALDREWRVYFGSEPGCLSGIAILPGMAIGGVLSWWFGLSQAPGIAVSLVLGIAVLWGITKLSGPPKQVPVTVADVAAAVETGVWPSVEADASSGSK